MLQNCKSYICCYSTVPSGKKVKRHATIFDCWTRNKRKLKSWFAFKPNLKTRININCYHQPHHCSDPHRELKHQYPRGTGNAGLYYWLVSSSLIEVIDFSLPCQSFDDNTIKSLYSVLVSAWEDDGKPSECIRRKPHLLPKVKTFYQRCLNSSVLILHLISDEYLTIMVGLINTK